MEQYISENRQISIDTTKTLTRLGNGWGSVSVNDLRLGEFPLR